MYALLDGQQLLLGPINFNIGMINSELEDIGLNFRVNSQDYLNVPISITESVQLVHCRQNIPNYDPRFQLSFQLGWEIIDGEVVFNYETRDKPLEQIKDEFKALLPPIRYSKESTIISIPIETETISVSTSRENRIALVSKLNSSDGPYNFKFEGGIWKEITKIDLQNILTEIDNAVQQAFDWEYQKIQEIDACSSKEEILMVDLS